MRPRLTDLEKPPAALLQLDESLLAALYDEIVIGPVHKLTRKHRFCDLDDRLRTEISSRFANESTVSILDVGASSGITSLELYSTLKGPVPVSMLATDAFDQLFVLRHAHPPAEVVFGPDRSPLQIIQGDAVYSTLQDESFRRPLARLRRRRALHQILPRAKARLKEILDDNATRGNFEYRTIPLWHPSTIEEMNVNPRFRVQNWDVFAEPPGRFHVVRVLNVLNAKYFTPDKQTLAVKNLAKALLPSGLLIVGRTIEEVDRQTRATGFALDGRRFVVAFDHGPGAENKELILSASW